MARGRNCEHLSCDSFSLFVGFCLQGHNVWVFFLETTLYSLVVTEFGKTGVPRDLDVMFFSSQTPHIIRIASILYARDIQLQINFTYIAVNNQFRKQVGFAFFKPSLCSSF